MAKLSFRIRSLDNTGFDNSTGNTGGRIFRKDGGNNVIRTGIGFFDRYSTFHTFIDMPFWLFLLFSLGAFIVVNGVFATYYFLLGPETLGLHPPVSRLFFFQECYFFSVQTLTTVGYGHYFPNTLHGNIVSAIETLFGWMAFAVLTGLLYARFSRPRAYLRFSKHALLAPYKQGKALMFRLAPYKNTILTEAEVKVNLALLEDDEGKKVNRFFTLPLELDRINTLTLNWTLVHPITEDSPMWNMNMETMKTNRMEILVFFRAYDEHFSNSVLQRFSYTAEEIIPDAKFVQMFKRSGNDQHTILELDKLDEYTTITPTV
jgi:inward rectifier potassium channel